MNCAITLRWPTNALFACDDELAFTPTFHLASGTVQAQVQVDTQTKQARNTQNARGDGQARWTDRLDWHGHSLADFLASANGNMLLSMVEGQIGKVLIELVGLDVAEAIEKAIAKEKTYQLRCLVADFAVHNGTMETQRLLVAIPPIPKLWAGGSSIYKKKRSD